MFVIYDGKTDFTQWDINQKLIVKDQTIKEVHFNNALSANALVCEPYELGGLLVVDVPNILLQEAMRIYAHAFCGECVRATADYEVNPRVKPSDYVYTETEVKTYAALDNRITEVEAELSHAIGNKADKEEWIIIDDFTLSTDSTGITRTTDRNYKPFKCKKIYCLCSISNGIGSQRTIAFPALDNKRVNLVVPANAFGFECSVEVLNKYGLIKYEGQAYTEKTLQVGNHGQIVKCVNNTTNLTQFSLYPQNGWAIPAGAHITIWGLVE